MDIFNKQQKKSDLQQTVTYHVDDRPLFPKIEKDRNEGQEALRTKTEPAASHSPLELYHNLTLRSPFSHAEKERVENQEVFGTLALASLAAVFFVGVIYFSLQTREAKNAFALHESKSSSLLAGARQSLLLPIDKLFSHLGEQIGDMYIALRKHHEKIGE